MDKVSKALKSHYTDTFEKHGANSQGVDWGADPAKADLRYRKMLAALPRDAKVRHSLLDVGCGYGGLLDHAGQNAIELDYTGIDVAENMVLWARGKHSDATFFVGDVLTHAFDRQYDFVVCNGVLTQKLDVPTRDMDHFAHRLIRRMFELCVRGIAFNIMTNKVNFHANNLYYRSPVEVLSWCMEELTPYVRVDHAYPLFEFTTYLFKDPS